MRDSRLLGTAAAQTWNTRNSWWPGRDQWVTWSKVCDKHNSLQQQLTFSAEIYMHRPDLNLPLQLTPVPKQSEMQTTPFSSPTPWERKKKVFLHVFITPNLTQTSQLPSPPLPPSQEEQDMAGGTSSACYPTPLSSTMISEQMKAGKLLWTGREETIQFSPHVWVLCFIWHQPGHTSSLLG